MRERGVPAKLRREVLARDLVDGAGQCWICLGWFEPGGLHVDHVVPVSRGGADTADNAALACQKCNTARGNRPIVRRAWVSERYADLIR